MPDFSIDVSDEVSAEAVRRQLPLLKPPLRLVAEGLLAETSHVDFVALDPSGHVVLLLVGEEGGDASLLTRALAHSAWVRARLENWRQLAPELGLAHDPTVRAMLLCPSFRPETLAAAEALGDAVQLVLCCSVRTGSESRLVFENLTGPRHEAPPRPVPPKPSPSSSQKQEPTIFRSGLSDDELELTVAERNEFF